MNTHANFGSSTDPGAMPTEEMIAPLSTWQRVKLIARVIEIRLRFVVILVGTGLVIGYWDTLQNYWDRWTRPETPAAAVVEAGSEFYCPMHPWVARAERDPDGSVPKCPICGMLLSTRKKGVAPELPASVTGRVQLSPERIRLAGLETVPIGYRPLVRQLETVGSVRFDESRLSRIVTRVNGYVERLLVDETFARVTLGQPMAELYSPELASAANELLLARRGGPGLDLAGLARRKLELLGLARAELDEMLRTGSTNTRLLVRSPQQGTVLRKDVVRGARVEVGQTLFEVADLSKVWIEADVYEKDVAFLRRGQSVEASVEAYPGRKFHGTVALVQPVMDASSRTNAVRFSVDNADLLLRPGMYAMVRLAVPLRTVEVLGPVVASAPPTGRASGPAETFVCQAHPDLLEVAPGKCRICKAPLERRALGPNQRLSWWCPMHPQVTSDVPGRSCELCGGMKLLARVVEVRREDEFLAVPEPAVIDTGTRRIVYVERDAGVYEGVLVELGPRVGELYPVLRGLQAGDRVVLRGAFLVDAETRLNPAAGAVYSGAAGGPKPAATAEAGGSSD